MLNPPVRNANARPWLPGLLAAAIAVLPVAANPARAATSSGCYAVVNVSKGDALNMRSGPSARNRVVGRLVPGRHGIISRTGPCVPRSASVGRRWCPVTHFSGNGTTTGWVKARFVTSTGCP